MNTRHRLAVMAFVAALLFGAFEVYEASARRGGFSSSRSFSSGRSFSSKSFSSSRSYSKPTRSTWGTRRGGGVTKSWGSKSRSTTKTRMRKATPTKPLKLKSKSRFDSNQIRTIRQQRSASSMKAYKTDTAKFKKPIKPASVKPAATKTYAKTGVYKKAPKYGRYDYNRNKTQRTSYYKGRNWSTPGYAYNSSPSFGMWDAMFMWWMLDSMQSNAEVRAMAHNHEGRS